MSYQFGFPSAHCNFVTSPASPKAVSTQTSIGWIQTKHDEEQKMVEVARGRQKKISEVIIKKNYITVRCNQPLQLESTYKPPPPVATTFSFFNLFIF